MVLGGLAAKQGYLNIYLVILYSFLGTTVGDAALFFLGKYQGTAILEKFPAIKRFMLKPQNFLERNGALLCFTMRFMYGFRNIVPFTLGISRMPTKTFIAFNSLGAIVWSVVIGILGFLFGTVLQVFLGKLKHQEFKVIMIGIILGALIILIFRASKYFFKKKLAT